MHGAAACVTEYVRPSIVRLPDRELVLVFGCAMNATSAVPPVPDEEIDNQGSLLVAPQPHTAGATTPTEPLPPGAGTEPASDWRL